MFASRRLPAAARKHQNLISLPNSNRPDLSHHPAFFFKPLDLHPAKRGAACQVDRKQTGHLANGTWNIFGTMVEVGSKATQSIWQTRQIVS